MSKLDKLRSSSGLLGSCKLSKLPAHDTLVSAAEALSIDFDQVNVASNCNPLEYFLSAVNCSPWKVGVGLSCVAQDMSRQFVLDPEAPALLIGCSVPAWRTNRTVGTETHIVQQPERIPCRLNQPKLKRIVQVHKRSCKVVWINRDHICVLIETCAAVGDNTSDPGARLPVVNAVASAYDCVWNDLIGEAEARLEVAPVGYVGSALFRR